ncbi:OmpA-OmpF porin, OOP family [Pseudomonas pohangensis]|jgi:OOP family OmpA-OmpF porin|uniref:OmpA-OmpF porin, OOP family n=1 Tax=Pseudomonas pohangensis TaxID=364197 RepID=A0A1H2FDE9_9PSED|nr:OmpA family protein [Pseudomonas pohangensis]SDU05381.1 OmpA-OmpF porin, OOP family [Pseudomonas pohangensis]
MQFKNSASMVIGTLVVAVSIGAHAQGKGAVEVSGFGKYYVPDSSRDIGSNGTLLGGAVSYYLTDDVTLGLNYGTYDNIDGQNSHKDIHGELGGLDATYHFGTLGDSLRPYISSGVAHQSIGQDNRGGRDKSSYINIGTGLKYYFTENLFADAGVTGMYNMDRGDTEYMAGLAVGVNFGGAGKKVEPAPAPAVCNDDDNDGVCDNADQCPDTEANVTVDADGCPAAAEAVRVELDVKFDFDKSAVKQDSYAEIKTVADFMNQYPQTTTTVEGYTDSVGSEAYNQQLSQRRADAVRQVMVDEYGVAADRVSAVGEGESDPVASNDTAEGRALNRRVEASVEAQSK